jgi:hypothetical protein
LKATATLIQKLDPSGPSPTTGRANSKHAASSGTQSIEASLPGRAENGASIAAAVLNSADSQVAMPLIEFLIEGIFPETQRNYVRASCEKGLARAITLHQAEEAIESFLRNEVARTEPEPMALAAYQAYLAHRLSTDSNRRAYVAKGREFPNAVFWPDPTDAKRPRSLADELPAARRIPLLDATTPIVSAGSCFAAEIANVLQERGFNYVVCEGNQAPDKSYVVLDSGQRAAASAAWGIIFNTPSFRQLVEKAFGERTLPKILWTQNREGELKYYDPFRENVEFPSEEAFLKNYDSHRLACREALTKAKVFIITLGLNEVWYFKADGSVFSRSPWKMAPNLIEHRVLTVEENLNDLQKMLDLLRKHNPSVEVIVTLSPVPLHATFLGDNSHVVTANAHSKAVLRVAAEEFVSRNRGVYYFPSYELITSCLKDPWAPDERHVTRAAVKKVMELFDLCFVKPGAGA